MSAVSIVLLSLLHKFHNGTNIFQLLASRIIQVNLKHK